MQATGIAGDRQGAIDGTDHLRQTAGFEKGWHQHEIRCGKSDAGQPFLEVAYGYSAVEVVFIGDIMEHLLEDILFDAPDMDERRVVIDVKHVESRLREIVDDEDLSRYIL